MNGMEPHTTPLNFIDGKVFADGLKNDVGLAFDSYGDLWGVENGAEGERWSWWGRSIIHQRNQIVFEKIKLGSTGDTRGVGVNTAFLRQMVDWV
jgi:hypothetical protein